VKYLFLIILSIYLFSCHQGIDNNKGTPLARVNDDFLYEDDLLGLIPDNITPQDSIVWVRNYVNRWVKSKLVIEKAEENLKPEQLNFKNQLEKYKASLITYKYESEYIKQNIDTAVSFNEIEKYYENHKNDFILFRNIVRVMYVVIEKNKKLENKFIEMFSLPDSVILDSLEYNSRMYAKDFFLDTTMWIPFDDLTKVIPIEIYNNDMFRNNDKFVNFSDNRKAYLIKFIDFKIKNDISPLELEEDNIRKIIINKRKIDLIRNLMDKLYQNAIHSNKIEIYLYE
jgi:hypothetical protein